MYTLLRFIVSLVLLVALSYLLQLFLYKQLYPEAGFPLLLFSYKFNFGFALLFGSSAILLSKYFPSQVGFLFMAGTVLKIGIFLLLINQRDLNLNKGNFLDFFTPYFLCTGLEIVFLSKILNRLNFEKDK